ncbi:MAG: histone deacetylase [Solirubrobacteraceae bacterium]|nr:histone deacetylase [Solirubrobacteraceae bacterium]
MGAPVLLMHESSLAHDTGPHPESAERIRTIERYLDAADWLPWERRASRPADREALLRVHPASHLDAIAELAAAGGGAIDADTVVSSGSWQAALHAAGAAVEVVDLLLSGAAPAAASAHRPPGHHCETNRAMGFCLLSNVAIAARHAVHAHGLERVMIVDWDVHHGNGTEQVLASDNTVLFTSIHQSPLYPGTGSAHEVGHGEGAGFTINLPVKSGAGDEVFVSLVQHVVVPLARSFKPQLILISAGYDAHEDDPLATCRVTDHGYFAMAAAIRAVAEDLEAPVGLILEGGYDVAALARSFVQTLDALGSADAPDVVPVLEHPLAGNARARAAEFWPDLG